MLLWYLYEAGMWECWSTQKGLYWQEITPEKAPKITGEKVSFQAKSSFFRPKTVSRLQNQVYPENSSSPHLCVELSKETRVCMEQRSSCSVVGRDYLQPERGSWAVCSLGIL